MFTGYYVFILRKDTVYNSLSTKHQITNTAMRNRLKKKNPKTTKPW